MNLIARYCLILATGYRQFARNPVTPASGKVAQLRMREAALKWRIARLIR